MSRRLLLTVLLVLLALGAIATFTIVTQVDRANRQYFIMVGDDIHYCNGYSYDDNGSLLLTDCNNWYFVRRYREVNRVIENPANVQIVEQRVNEDD